MKHLRGKVKDQGLCGKWAYKYQIISG